MALWTDFRLLWQDMERYARSNPEARFLCADNPRVDPPRFGWVAFHDDKPDREVSEMWEIELPVFKQTARSIWSPEIQQAHLTASGRQAHLQAMIKRMRNLPLSPTRWERLESDDS